jgi:HSP20 family protein
MSLIPFFEDDLFTSVLRGFPSMSGALAQTGGDSASWTRGMPVDIKETDKEFQLKADVPGMQKEDIKVNVNADVLTISVEKTAGKEETKEEKGVKYHRQERSSTFASRSIRMPETADLGKIGARYQDGVLLLSVPKQADTAAKHRQIQIE